MRVGIYALAKNEAGNVPAWEASCRDADVRVVTDTGSTDDTVAMLKGLGVIVARGCPVPWRWDDAHNLSLYHLPADVDVAIRLDLDEVLDAGWRDALEESWTPETTKLRYWYQWSHDVRFLSDRVHLRSGYRWQGATHEGLSRWSGEEVQTQSDNFTIRHHRQPGKTHKTDLTLLRQAVRENPLDTRMHWYLARELDYAADPEAAAAFEKYLQMPNGSATERAYAFRALARLQPDRKIMRLLEAIQASPKEAEAFLALAEMAERMQDWVSTLYYARHARYCPQTNQTHASDPRAYSALPADLACIAASKLGLDAEALSHAREAFKRDPADTRLAGNLGLLEAKANEKGPKAA